MLRMRMVESSQAIASDDDDRDAATAKMGGRVGRVDCERENQPESNPS
jgi:hypothetical protein